MPKLIFRGSFIRFVDLRYDEKAKTRYVKLNMSAEFTDPVREAMGWSPLPDSFTGADLSGELTATKFVLTPNGKEINTELALDVKQVADFSVVRVKDDQEGATHCELRFQIVTTAKGAAALAEAYLDVVGKGQGQLRVNYEEQTKMDLGGEEPQSERLISEEQAHDTSAATDEGPTLAPAALVGGTHQRGTRQRQSTEKLN